MVRPVSFNGPAYPHDINTLSHAYRSSVMGRRKGGQCYVGGQYGEGGR